MNKHEALVRKIAAEMAEREFVLNAPKLLYIQGFNEIPDKTKREFIADKLEDARIAVKHMAIEFRAGFRCGEGYCVKVLNKQSTEWCTKAPLLIERGLIPETEKEVEK